MFLWVVYLEMLKLRLAAIVKTPEHIYLGFGSNLGDREAVFRASLKLLADAGCTISQDLKPLQHGTLGRISWR